MLRWLEERQPDVLGVQELKSTDDQFPADDFESAGYHCAIHGQKAWNGVGIFAREPVEVTQVGLPEQGEQGARLIAADVGELSFITVYCPNGKSVDHPDFPAKLRWFDSLLEFIDGAYSPEDSLVLCGDFNIVPAAVDSWNEDILEGTIFHTVAERERYRALIDWGFHDVFRERQPETPGYTWWDYRGGAFRRKHGLRIDFIMGTDPVFDAVQYVNADRDWRAKIDGMTPSDHAPLYADLATPSSS
jgi:exodeoxyribonuclease-3